MVDFCLYVFLLNGCSKQKPSLLKEPKHSLLDFHTLKHLETCCHDTTMTQPVGKRTVSLINCLSEERQVKQWWQEVVKHLRGSRSVLQSDLLLLSTALELGDVSQWRHTRQQTNRSADTLQTKHNRPITTGAHKDRKWCCYLSVRCYLCLCWWESRSCRFPDCFSCVRLIREVEESRLEDRSLMETQYAHSAV